ncbi:YcxB family protein [Variovorax sp. H27-G14]|uniref:YcxB family protein n=1 Tax=Variovorax sp. H27-G14 TaxID=3111914 RepID=UPI0038FCBA31
MIANFSISEDDYAAAMSVFGRPTRWRRRLLIGLLAVLVPAALFGGALARPVALGGLVGVGIVLAISFIVAPMMARRHYRSYKAMQAEFAVELLDTGLRLSSPHGAGTVVWENMLKWRQSDRFVLIYPMPRLFHIVPKSVAAQGFDLPGLLEGLNRHVGPEV